MTGVRRRHHVGGRIHSRKFRVGNVAIDDDDSSLGDCMGDELGIIVRALQNRPDTRRNLARQQQPVSLIKFRRGERPGEQIDSLPRVQPAAATHVPTFDRDGQRLPCLMALHRRQWFDGVGQQQQLRAGSVLRQSFVGDRIENVKYVEG